MTNTTPKPFIGFILTPTFQVKPVEVRPHPVMNAYGVLPTGRTIRLSHVHATAPQAVQSGRDALADMGVSIKKAMDKFDQRKANLDKAHHSISKAGEPK